MPLPAEAFDDSTAPGNPVGVVNHSVTGSPILPASAFVAEDRYQAKTQLEKVKTVAQGTGTQDSGFWSNLWRSGKAAVEDQGTAVKQLADRYAQATGGAGSGLDTSMTAPGINPSQSNQATAQQAGSALQASQAQQQQVEQARAAGPQPSGFAGHAGSIIGGVAPSLAEAAVVPGGPIAGGVLQGALGGALTPTTTNQPSMGKNVGISAAAGGVLGGVGKAVGSLGFTNMLTDRANALVDYLDAKGVPMDLAQRTGSKFAGTLKNMVQDSPFTHKLDADQAASFTQNVMQRMGGAETQATPDALGRESLRISNAKDAIQRNMGPVPLDTQGLHELASIQGGTSDIPNESTRNMINKKVNDIFDSATMQPSGQLFFNSAKLNNAKMDLDNWVLGDDSILKNAGSQIQTALDGVVSRNAPPGTKPAIDELNRQTRVFLQAAKAATPDGNIPPGKFWTATTPNGRGFRTAKTDLTGDQNTAELARSGQEILNKNTPNSGTVPRAMAQKLGANLAGAAVGGGVGYEAGGKQGAWTGALGAGLGGALGSAFAGRAAQSLIEPSMARFLARAATMSQGRRAVAQKVGGRVGASFRPFVPGGLNTPSQTAQDPDDTNTAE